MSSERSMDAAAGASIYNQAVLRIYDWYVLGFSNRFVWRCPTPVLLDFYNQHVSANHLDVGVGTGYYLDKCQFPAENPRIALMDLNPNSLKTTANRIKRYAPTTHVANVLEPIETNERAFDSIGINYLLHCLPGDMASKSVVFANLKPLLNPGGTLFGSTILGKGVQHNRLGRRLMKIYNKRAIFSNIADDLEQLERNLSLNFSEHLTRVVGTVALFMGRV